MKKNVIRGIFLLSLLFAVFFAMAGISVAAEQTLQLKLNGNVVDTIVYSENGIVSGDDFAKLYEEEQTAAQYSMLGSGNKKILGTVKGIDLSHLYQYVLQKAGYSANFTRDLPEITKFAFTDNSGNKPFIRTLNWAVMQGYYFPAFFTTDNTADDFVVSADGAVAVEPMLGMYSSVGTVTFASVTAERLAEIAESAQIDDTLEFRNFYGQQEATMFDDKAGKNANSSVSGIDEIDITPVMYDVTVDGQTTKIPHGADFTVPDLGESDGAAAWTDGEKIYLPGDQIFADHDMTFEKAKKLVLKVQADDGTIKEAAEIYYTDKGIINEDFAALYNDEQIPGKYSMLGSGNKKILASVKGITLHDLYQYALNKAGYKIKNNFKIDNDTTFTFTDNSGNKPFSRTLNWAAMQGYYFPAFFTTDNTADDFVVSADGAVAVEPMLGMYSSVGTVTFASVTAERLAEIAESAQIDDTLEFRNFYGQQEATMFDDKAGKNANSSVSGIDEIIIKPVIKNTSGGGGSAAKYTVTFMNGEQTLAAKTVYSGNTVEKIADPVKDGYKFKGWYTDKECTKAYDFNSRIGADTVLYAGWQAVVSYSDINGHWAEKDILFVTEKGIMNGVSDALFAPDDNTTRAMVATVLWRLAGEPAVSDNLPFDDVAADSWYEKAVLWANVNGIIKGTSATTFDPEAKITREDLAVMLYRYAQTKGLGFTGNWMFNLEYADAANISEYAYEAVAWCSMHGILSGKESNMIDPQGNATRAEIAAVLTRYCEEIVK